MNKELVDQIIKENTPPVIHAPYNWQPIETAPKDGNLILAATSNATNWKGFFVVYWSAWDKDWAYSVDRVAYKVTHWMSLPAPPSIAKGSDE